MTAAAPLIRPAKLEEAEEIAALSRTSRAHFLPYLPQLHTPEEDKAFFRNTVFSECEVWGAEEGARLSGFALSRRIGSRIFTCGQAMLADRSARSFWVRQKTDTTH